MIDKVQNDGLVVHNLERMNVFFYSGRMKCSVSVEMMPMLLLQQL